MRIHWNTVQQHIIRLSVLIACTAGGALPSQENSETPSIQFSEHLIADNYAYAYGIAAADFDQDGDLDLSSADYTPHNKLYLFENNGSGQFSKHTIQQDDPERLERHEVGDVDNDGDLDIVIVKNLYGHLLWFENSGTPTDGQWWKRHVITTNLPGAYDVALADFNNDGNLDVAASSWVLGNQFAWFENSGNPRGDWKHHPLKENWRSANQVIIADMNGDGKPDIVACAERGSLEVRWWKNEGRTVSQTR